MSFPLQGGGAVDDGYGYVFDRLSTPYGTTAAAR
jgi:hypothetical protein